MPHLEASCSTYRQLYHSNEHHVVTCFIGNTSTVQIFAISDPSLVVMF